MSWKPPRREKHTCQRVVRTLVPGDTSLRVSIERVRRIGSRRAISGKSTPAGALGAGWIKHDQPVGFRLAFWGSALRLGGAVPYDSDGETGDAYKAGFRSHSVLGSKSSTSEP